MKIDNLILIINPGSTSTKVALFKGTEELCSESLVHPAEELAKYEEINDQYELRKQAVEKFLERNNTKVSDLDAIACRGGAVASLEPGAYVIDELFTRLARDTINPHAANLAIMIGYEFSQEYGVPAYSYDLVCGTGKPEEIFKISGLPGVERSFFTHVLNSRAVCFEQARRDNTTIYENTYIVCHLGGGFSTNLIVNGVIKDLVADDENGFSCERSGGVPLRPLIRLCFSGKYTEKEVQKLIKGKSGLVGYLGTPDMLKVEEMINDGDEYAKLIVDAMILQLAKDIGSMATVVNGQVDKIIFTGGVAYYKYFIDEVSKRVGFIAPISVIPGSFEMEALAGGINRVLNGEEEAKIYTEE